MKPPAIIASAVDIASVRKRVHLAYVAVSDAERAEEEANKSASIRREVAGRARIDCGRALIEARKAWPARGPKAKGWGDFLRDLGIEERSARRFMELAGFVGEVSDTGESVSEIPTYADAGIVKRPARVEPEEPREIETPRSRADATYPLSVLDEPSEIAVASPAVENGANVGRTVEQMIATSRSLLSQAERLDLFAREGVRIAMEPHAAAGLRVGLVAAKTSIEKALHLMGWEN